MDGLLEIDEGRLLELNLVPGIGVGRAAEAALQSARLNLGYTQVRAPVSGRVGRLEVTVGSAVIVSPQGDCTFGRPSVTRCRAARWAKFWADRRAVRGR